MKRFSKLYKRLKKVSIEKSIFIGFFIILLRCGKGLPYDMYYDSINGLFDYYTNYDEFTRLFNILVSIQFIVPNLFGYFSYWLCIKLGPRCVAILGLCTYELSFIYSCDDNDTFLLIIKTFLLVLSYCLLLNSLLTLSLFYPANSHLIISSYLIAGEISTYRYYFIFTLHNNAKTFSMRIERYISILITIICILLVIINVPNKYPLPNTIHHHTRKMPSNPKKLKRKYISVPVSNFPTDPYTLQNQLTTDVEKGNATDIQENPKIVFWQLMVTSVKGNILYHLFNKEFLIFLILYFISWLQKNLFILGLQLLYLKFGNKFKKTNMFKKKLQLCLSLVNFSNIGFCFWSILLHNYGIKLFLFLTSTLSFILIVLSTSEAAITSGITSLFFLIYQSSNTCLPMAYCGTYSNCENTLEILGTLTGAAAVLSLPLLYYWSNIKMPTMTLVEDHIDLLLILGVICFICTAALLMLDNTKLYSSSKLHTNNDKKQLLVYNKFVPLNIYFCQFQYT